MAPTEKSLIALFALNLVLLALSGASPGYPRPPAYSYPVGWVLATALVMAAELALFWAIVRPRSYRRSWGRALVAAAVFAPWGVACAITIMHAPGYVVGRATWNLELAAVSLALLAASLGSLAIRGLRARVS